MVQESLDQLFVVQDLAENAQVLGTDINLKDAEPIPQGAHKRSNRTINILTVFNQDLEDLEVLASITRYQTS